MGRIGRGSLLMFRNVATNPQTYAKLYLEISISSYQKLPVQFYYKLYKGLIPGSYQPLNMQINLYHIAAFSLANLLAHFNVSYFENPWLQTHFDYDLYFKLSEFASLQTANNGSENKNIVGHSFYYNMFQQNVPIQYFLPSLKIVTFQELNTPVEIMNKIISDRLVGKEGAYVSGGVIGDKFIGPVYPSSMYYVMNELDLKSSDIVEKMLPGNILNPEKPKTANSRTLQTLASLLLGLIHDNDFAETLVMKESTFGHFQWSKVVDAQLLKKSKNIFLYRYDEIRFMNKDETIYTFKFFDKKVLKRDLLNSVKIHDEECYVLHLEYELKIDLRKKKDEQRDLRLGNLIIVNPQLLNLI